MRNKTTINAIIIFSMLAICGLARAQRFNRRVRCESDEMRIGGECVSCLVADVDVHTQYELEQLSEEQCIIGNVAIVGPDYGDDGRFTGLDFGDLRRIRGNLIISLPYVQSILEEGLRIYGWATVINCPWLCWQEAKSFLDSVGTSFRVLRAGLKSSGCE